MILIQETPHNTPVCHGVVSCKLPLMAVGAGRAAVTASTWVACPAGGASSFSNASCSCFLRALAPLPFLSLSWFLSFHSGIVFFNAATKSGAIAALPAGAIAGDGSVFYVPPNGYEGAARWFAMTAPQTTGSWQRGEFFKLNISHQRLSLRLNLAGAGCGCKAKRK